MPARQDRIISAFIRSDLVTLLWVPDRIDEDFLREVASASGCGSYYNAQDAISLANIYVELRHSSTGTIVFNQSGTISQGQQLDLGAVDIPANQELMLLTLNWPGSKLEPVLKDPSGKTVDENYPGVSISTSPTLVSIIMNNPVQGSWQLGVVGVSVPEGTTQYNTIMSTRAGTGAYPTTCEWRKFSVCDFDIGISWWRYWRLRLQQFLKKDCRTKGSDWVRQSSTGWYRRDVCQSNHGPAGWSGDRTWFHQRPPIE